MAIKTIDGELYKNLVINGALNLKANYKRIDELNVFPVPDGDTGTNMRMTIEAGSVALKDEQATSLCEVAKSASRSILMGARGNSGVILSQFFRGLYKGFKDYKTCTVKQFADAMQSGVDQAYHAVLKPVEGTILTVARESVKAAHDACKKTTTLEEYFNILINEAEASLNRTPDLLPVLKEAGVVDSGGAGFIEVMKGMQKYLNGEQIVLSEDLPQAQTTTIDRSKFNAHSTLEYGYCTEFILQLQYSKVDIANFDIKVISDWLETIGNSIVALQDEDIVKVHVHTFDPGLVLSHCREYGEYLTLKIENMQVSHTESGNVNVAGAQCNCPQCVAMREGANAPKKIAVVAVASGAGLVNVFQDLGVDYVVSGGQSMNPSADDFVKGFDMLNAENILVFPNNSNIVLTAEQAAKYYKGDAKITVVPSKTLAQGYSALTMMDLSSGNVEEIVEELKETISNVTTGLITYSIRDTEFEDIKINKDDYIGICNGKIVSSLKDRVESIKQLLANTDIAEKEIITIIYGAGVTEDEITEVKNYIRTTYHSIEMEIIEGNQDVYSYIFSIE